MNTFTLEAALKLDKQQYENGLKEASSDADSFGSKIASGLGTAVKAVGAAAVAAGAAVTGVVKSAVESYANYEQLIGGVETLFKNSADVVEQYANNAYKTAGLSANEYMETVTSFSASLLQSVGGDTEKAAKYADQAITDMSDNANKMGTSMEMITSAYGAFAKQNYTLLDNLKLGYGGTKEEMIRLIDDANKLAKAQGKAGDLTIESYADIVEAIHLVQVEMGIYKTTEKEAASTIQGSLAMTKSAWKNVLTGIADDTQDFGVLIDNLVTSVDAFAKNIIPRIQKALEGVGRLVEALAPKIIEALPGLIESVVPGLIQAISSMLPSVMTAAVSLVESVFAAIPDLIPGLITAVTTLVSELVGALPKLAQTLIDALPDMITAINEGLIEQIPTMLEQLAGIIAELAIMLSDPEMLGSLQDTGLAIMMALVEGIVNMIPILLEAAPTIIINLLTALLNAIPKLLDAGVDVILTLIDAIINALPQLVEMAPKIIFSLLTALLNAIPKLLESGIKIIKKLIEGIVTAIPELLKKVPEIISGIAQTMLNGLKAITDVGLNIVRGLWSGISSGVSWLWNKVKGWIGGLWDGILGLLGIASPSKKMKWVGQMMNEGLAKGIDQFSNKAINSAVGLADSVSSALSGINSSYDIGATLSGEIGTNMGNASALGTSVSMGGININVYGAEGQSVNELAEVISEKLANEYDRRVAVYA